jgi:hypothetical protein
MFPGSRFVIIVRHPLAYAYPRNDETGTWNVYNRIKHWLVCHEHLREDVPYLKQVIILKYEEFVRAPQKHLSRIFAFLDVPDHPPEQEIRTDINAKYIGFWNASAARLPGSLVTKAISASFEGRVRSFGYSIMNPEMVGPWAGVLA